MRPEDVSCPKCQAPPGSLSVEFKLAAKPLGTWSLAGAQTKVAAEWRPVLACSDCDFFRVGSYDGHHATFPAEESS